jgi:hypothetical protein
MPLLSLDMLLYQLSSALASLESIIFFGVKQLQLLP